MQGVPKIVNSNFWNPVKVKILDIIKRIKIFYVFSPFVVEKGSKYQKYDCKLVFRNLGSVVTPFI